MILYLFLFVVFKNVESYDISDAQNLLKKIVNDVRGLPENKLDDYIHHLFEYTTCEGEVKNRTDFIKIFLDTVKHLKIEYFDEGKIIVKSYRHTKGKSYPEYSTEPYIFFDVMAGFNGSFKVDVISAVNGSFGFSARKKESGIFRGLVLDKVINYNCDYKMNNQTKFQNYAYFIRTLDIFNKIKRSDNSFEHIRKDFNLFSCPKQLNNKPIESFKWLIQNTEGGVEILDLKKITEQKWEVTVRLSGTEVNVTMEYEKTQAGQYTNYLMVTTASEIACLKTK